MNIIQEIDVLKTMDDHKPFCFDIDDFSAYPIFLPPKQDQSDISRALRAKVAPGPNDMSKCGAPGPVPRFHRRPTGKHS